MFICAIWLFHWYFPRFSKSDMWKYGYHKEFFLEGLFDFEITRVDCISFKLYHIKNSKAGEHKV